ncbi:hypothetical protein LSH36_141g08016 [Paralvinella palmiformis]|uniref:PPM-type phosphatase domain-containing protein n=1 Tax=Paralvinella palmiformis TaxID=53620 RepID=A0AAD9JW29_9ANNE|nr:hypothetical protein LSH36_141g08016 [Paralvinella palmiformis]
MRNSGVPATQSGEPEFEVVIEPGPDECWKRRWTNKKKAGTEVWFGRTADQLPNHDVTELVADVFASYSGPDQGLAIVPELEPVPSTSLENGNDDDANSNDPSDKTPASTSVTPPAQSATEPTTEPTTDPQTDRVAGVEKWNSKSRKAYGISMSLYEQHPINGKISVVTLQNKLFLESPSIFGAQRSASTRYNKTTNGSSSSQLSNSLHAVIRGDPIADSFGICSRTNNSIMIVADGVNWGEKSKLAARCAIYGSMNYINKRLFGDNKSISDTNESFQVLLEAVNCAHQTIIQYGGGQTTLCMALILPLKDSRQFAVCIVNVGDSLAYVFSKYHGIREITTGSHDIQSERDIRDAGGAVGPVHGNDPELHNLTCSMTLVDPGDVVYLTTDGISDNFDPVVTKIAVASRRRHSDPHLQPLPEEGSSNMEGTSQNVRCGTLDGKPEMEPHERHQYAVKEMERIIHEFELFTEQPCSAQELCGALLQHVLKLTDPKRKVLENPDLYGKKLRSKDRKRRDSEIIAKLSKSPGKLDHATIISYEVGIYHGDDDEDYEVVEEVSDEEMEEVENTENTVSQFNFDESLPGVVSKHDSNKVHDVLYACNNSHHGNSGHSPILSPESQKKKNSLKNLRLRVRSRFKGPGHRSHSESIPSPETLKPGDVKSPNKSSSLVGQLSSSAPDQGKAQRMAELKNALTQEHAKQQTMSEKTEHVEKPSECSPIKEVEASSLKQSPIEGYQSQSDTSPTALLVQTKSTDQSSVSPPFMSPTGRIQGRRALRRAQAQRPHSSPPSDIELTSSYKLEVQRSSERTFSEPSEKCHTTATPGAELSSNQELEKDTWIIRPKLSEAPVGVHPVRQRRQKRRAQAAKSNPEQRAHVTVSDSSKVGSGSVENEPRNAPDVQYMCKLPTSQNTSLKVSPTENVYLPTHILSPSHSKDFARNPFFVMQTHSPSYNGDLSPATYGRRSVPGPTSDLSPGQSPNGVPLSHSVPTFKYNKRNEVKLSQNVCFVMTSKTCTYTFETAI